MLNKKRVFFSVVIILGILDWLTTVIGIFFCGATEANPLLSGLTQSSMLLFSVVKFSALLLGGFAFYKASAISESATGDWQFPQKITFGAYSLTSLILAAVVTSNMITILGSHF